MALFLRRVPPRTRKTCRRTLMSHVLKSQRSSIVVVIICYSIHRYNLDCGARVPDTLARLPLCQWYLPVCASWVKKLHRWLTWYIPPWDWRRWKWHWPQVWKELELQLQMPHSQWVWGQGQPGSHSFLIVNFDFHTSWRWFHCCWRQLESLANHQQKTVLYANLPEVSWVVLLPIFYIRVRLKVLVAMPSVSLVSAHNGSLYIAKE